MTRDKAIKSASDKGYTIRYLEDENELRFRKPGGAVNSLNLPYEYCRVYRDKRSWLLEEKVEPLII